MNNAKKQMSRTKKILLILAIIVSIPFLIYFSLLSYYHYIASEANAFLKPMYIDLSNNHWNQKTLFKYASPGFKKAVKESIARNPSGYRMYTKYLTSLGALKEYKGKDIVKSEGFSAIITMGSLSFPKGKHDVLSNMSKIDGQWRLNSFRFYKTHKR